MAAKLLVSIPESLLYKSINTGGNAVAKN